MSWKDRHQVGIARRLTTRSAASVASMSLLLGLGTFAGVSSPASATHQIIGNTTDSVPAPKEAGLISGPMSLNQPIVGMAATPDGKGYWLVAKDGGIFSFGDAVFYGSTGAMTLNKPVVGMAATPDGHGYWLVASDGGIFTFGDAGFYGSTGAMTLNKPVVGMASSPDGHGYWLVASDGGIFTFGDATFEGSAGAIQLNQPIVGMAATPDGKGYWLVAQDGGIFTYGDAPYEGSEGGQNVAGIVGISKSGTNSYYFAGSNGSSYYFSPSTPQPTASTTPGTSSGASLVPYTGQTWNSFGVTSDTSSTFSSAMAPTTQSAPSVTGFGFLVTQPNSTLPVRYNPCAPIHYVVNINEAPAYGLQLVQNAFTEIGQATGMQFIYDGTTSELPSTSRPAYVNGAPNPILVSWEHNGETSYLPSSNSSGEVVGMGGSQYTYNSTAGQYQYVSGEAAISSSYPLSEDETIHLVLHELGHVIGLGHTTETNQIMYPYDEASPITYANGDLQGLASLGMAAGCLS